MFPFCHFVMGLMAKPLSVGYKDACCRGRLIHYLLVADPDNKCADFIRYSARVEHWLSETITDDGQSALVRQLM